MKTEMLSPILAVCAVMLIGMVCFDRCGHGHEETTADTISSIRYDTVHDTVYVPEPVVVESRAIDMMAVKLPQWRPANVSGDTSETVGTTDSVTVGVPIEQKHYAGENYDAWVSGYRPSLDSLRIYRPITTVTETHTITKWRTRRWGLSAGVGMSMSHQGVAPAVFVGVSYTFLAF